MKNFLSIHFKKAQFFLENYLKNRPKLKQWLWFLALWLFGLGFVMLATYPVKFLVGFL
jgi:hypothetical protein